MKMMKHTLSTESTDLIANANVSVSLEMCEDLLAIFELTPQKSMKQMKDFQEIMDEMSLIKFVDVDEFSQNVFNYRRDIRRFIVNPAFFSYLDTNMTDDVEKKKAIITMAEMVSQQNQANQQQSQSGSAGSEEEEEALQAQTNAGTIDYFQNLLNGMVFADYQEEENPEDGSGFSRSKRRKDKLSSKQADAKVRDKIQRVVKWLMQGNLKIFELAKNFKAQLDKKDEISREEVKIGDTSHQRKMRSIADVKNMSTSDKVLPDDELDSKVARKDLTVIQQDKIEHKSQNILALIDKSGSMGSTKMAMAKALLISLGLRAFKSKVKRFDYIAFDDATYDRVSVDVNSDWIDFLQSVINIPVGNGTNLHHALSKASEEIESNNLDSNEIIVITDGTEPVDKEEFDRRVKFPAHCLLLGDYNQQFIDEYKRTFKSVIHSPITTMNEAMVSGMKFIDMI